MHAITTSGKEDGGRGNHKSEIEFATAVMYREMRASVCPPHSPNDRAWPSMAGAVLRGRHPNEERCETATPRSTRPKLDMKNERCVTTTNRISITESGSGHSHARPEYFSIKFLLLYAKTLFPAVRSAKRQMLPPGTVRPYSIQMISSSISISVLRCVA